MSIEQQQQTPTTTTTPTPTTPPTRRRAFHPTGFFLGEVATPIGTRGEFIDLTGKLHSHGEDEEGIVGGQEWPLLPGTSSGGEFIKPEVRAEAGFWRRRTAQAPERFRLGNLGDWPCLEGKIGQGRVKSQGLGLGLLDGNRLPPTSGADGRADILTSTGPTGENQLKSFHLGGFTTGERAFQTIQGGGGGGGVGGSSSGGGGGRCRGWIRLPPIPKRWRVESNNSAQDSNSNSNSNSLGQVGGNIFPGRNGGRDGLGRGGGGGGGDRDGLLPPVYLMLNRDFIVISPLKENLLLTLALTTRRNPSSEEAEELDRDAMAESVNVVCRNKRPRRHVFVGRFEAFSSFVRFGLGRDARRVVTEANAGGTSTISESLSVEYFVRKFQAKDVVPEMEVEYCAMNWKKVDYICSLYDQRVGVSVTRAMSYPNPEDFSPQMAYRLLYKKLFGLVVARHGVTERHSFSQCILHVWCETTMTAELLEAQYKQVSEELDITDDVIMVLTVAEGWHARPIFYEHCLERS